MNNSTIECGHLAAKKELESMLMFLSEYIAVYNNVPELKIARILQMLTNG
jgi:hypothetical protein